MSVEKEEGGEERRGREEIRGSRGREGLGEVETRGFFEGLEEETSYQ